MAQRNIKGITIEIGGDTTNLQKALGGVNKDLRTTESNLRDVNKLLKLDPSNVDLLKQKQDYLNQRITETKKKLDTEKEALKQLKNSDTSGKVTEQQKALEREIADTEQALKQAQKEMKEFGSVGAQQAKQVASKMEAAGKKITAVGKGLTTHVTAPIAAVGAASVAAWKEVDEAMDTVTTKTGASGEALKEMQESAKNLAKTIPTDFQTAADAVGEVNTRFGLTGEALENLSGQFVEFAKLNNTDVSSSVDGVQRVMAAFGVESEKAGDVLDLLNKVGQDTGLSMDALEGSLTKNASALQGMGFNLSDSAKFLGDLEKSGAESSKVMAGLKKAFQQATKEGKPMSTAMQEVQTSILGAKDDIEAAQIATDYFGKAAGPSIAQAVRDGKLSFEDLGTSLQDYSGNVKSTFEETLDPMDKMQTTMNTLKDLGADIVETSAPAIETAMTSLRDVVEDLADKWNGLSEDQQQMIIKAALIVAALGPVITVIGGVVGIVSTLTGAIGGIVGALGASGAAGAAGAAGAGLIPALGALASAAAPFLIGGAIVVGLISATIAIVQNWDKIKAAAIKLKDTVVQKWNEIKTTVINTVENLKTMILNKWESIKTSVLQKVDALKTGISGTWDAIKTKATETFEGIKTAITDKITAAKDTLSGIVETIKGLFNFEWSLPDLKLPHINVGGYIEVPVLGTIPDPTQISVDWYKRAYQNPVMFTSPTVLQTPQGYKGFGDGSGGEIVLSDAKLRQIAGAGASYTVNVYASPGMNVNQLADAVQNRLVALQRQKEAAGIA